MQHNILLKTLNQIRKPTCIDEVLSYPLWEGENIKIGDSSVYYKNWTEAGIWTVHDLLDNQGKIMSFQNFQQLYQFRPIYFILLWNSKLA